MFVKVKSSDTHYVEKKYIIIKPFQMRQRFPQIS